MQLNYFTAIYLHSEKYLDSERWYVLSNLFSNTASSIDTNGFFMITKCKSLTPFCEDVYYGNHRLLVTRPAVSLSAGEPSLSRPWDNIRLRSRHLPGFHGRTNRGHVLSFWKRNFPWTSSYTRLADVACRLGHWSRSKERCCGGKIFCLNFEPCMPLRWPTVPIVLVGVVNFHPLPQSARHPVMP